MDEDFFLVRQIKSGREESVEKFVRKYYPSILNYCYGKVRDHMQAEDLTQQTFLNFFQALNRYEHRGKAKNFLYVIAGNLCKNYFEKQEKVPQTFLPEESREELPDEKTLHFSTKMAEAVSIEDALMLLSKEQREVILLYYFQELKIREIAEILGQTQSNIKYRLKAAKERLKEILRKEDFL